MQYQRYGIEMDLTGVTRKQAAELMSEVFNKPITYDNTTDTYAVKDVFGRDWTIGKTDGITRQKINGDRIIGANFMYDVKLSTPLIYRKDFEEIAEIAAKLERVGAITNDTTKLCVNVDAKGTTEKSVQNINNIMESKGDLIYKAVQTRQPEPVSNTNIGEESVIRFPMFNSTLSADKIQSYVHLATAINHQALSQNNVSPKKNGSPNDKFTFRTWLIRLGMVGSDYKTTRSVLMENLEGNTAWKNPDMAPGHKQDTVQSESPVPESVEASLTEPEIEQEQEQSMNMSM